MARLPKIGDLLVEVGAITRSQLADALRHQEQTGGRLGTSLVALGFIDDKAIAGALAKQLQIPSVTQAQLETIAPEVLALVPGQLAARRRLVPLRIDKGRLWVASSDPTDKDNLDELSRLVKMPVRPMVATDMTIDAALERHYQIAPVGRATAAPPSPEEAAPDPFFVDGGLAGPSLDEIESATGYLDAPPRPVSSGAAHLPSLLPPPPPFAPPPPPFAPPPAAPSRPPAPPARDLVAQLVEANTDEEVLDAVLRHLAPEVPRLCALLLRDGELSGWRAIGVSAAEMRAAQAALADLPMFERALESGSSFVGGLESSMLGTLAGPLGIVNEALGLILPLRIGKHPVGVLVGVDASLDVLRRKPELDKLAQKIGHALHRNHLRRLLLQP
jgi:hypothetical protein